MRRVALVSTAVLVALAGCGSESSSPPATSGPATVQVRSTALGPVLVDGSGRTLYLFEADQGTRSSCSGDCAKAWPPLVSEGAPKAGEGAKAALLGTTMRSDGTTEVTYAGHPLYRYAEDEKAGDTKGQGSEEFGAEWYALDAQGKANERESKGSSSGGRYGY